MLQTTSCSKFYTLVCPILIPISCKIFVLPVLVTFELILYLVVLWLLKHLQFQLCQQCRILLLLEDVWLNPKIEMSNIFTSLSKLITIVQIRTEVLFFQETQFAFFYQVTFILRPRNYFWARIGKNTLNLAKNPPELTFLNKILRYLPWTVFSQIN